jgi:hypothetical protein
VKTYGGVEEQLFTFAMDRVSGELHAPAPLLLTGKDFGRREKTGLEFGGSRAGLGALANRKSYCSAGNRNRIVRSFVQAIS